MALADIEPLAAMCASYNWDQYMFESAQDADRRELVRILRHVGLHSDSLEDLATAAEDWQALGLDAAGAPLRIALSLYPFPEDDTDIEDEAAAYTETLTEWVEELGALRASRNLAYETIALVDIESLDYDAGDPTTTETITERVTEFNKVLRSVLRPIRTIYYGYGGLTQRWTSATPGNLGTNYVYQPYYPPPPWDLAGPEVGPICYFGPDDETGLATIASTLAVQRPNAGSGIWPHISFTAYSTRAGQATMTYDDWDTAGTAALGRLLGACRDCFPIIWPGPGRPLKDGSGDEIDNSEDDQLARWAAHLEAFAGPFNLGARTRPNYRSWP